MDEIKNELKSAKSSINNRINSNDEILNLIKDNIKGILNNEDNTFDNILTDDIKNNLTENRDEDLLRNFNDILSKSGNEYNKAIFEVKKEVFEYIYITLKKKTSKYKELEQLILKCNDDLSNDNYIEIY